MGLLVGILIGVFCRRFLTAFFWCLGVSVLVAGFLMLGAAQDAAGPLSGKVAIVAVAFVGAMVFLNAGAMGVVAIKRVLAKRKAEAASPRAEVFGPAPGAHVPPPSGPLSGGA